MFSPTQPETKKPVLDKDILEALKAAAEIGPRVYHIVNLPLSGNLNICVFGCQGGKGQESKKVAEFINKKAKENKDFNPHLFLILGDNFYPDGVNSPIDKRFETQFHDIYGNSKLIYEKIPCLVALGNHDGGRDTRTQFLNTHTSKTARDYLNRYFPYLKTNQLNEGAAEQQQIAHCMLPHHSDPPDLKSKKTFFQQKELDYALLPKHIMPHFFYSFVLEKLQIFVLNSNTYVKDYLDYLKAYANDQPIDANNQAVWLKEQYSNAINNGRTVLFAMHHPLSTTGKRAYSSGWDAKHYLKPHEIAQIEKILELSPEKLKCKDTLKTIFSGTDKKNNTNYNKLLSNIFYNAQHVQPHMVCAAHDHAIYYDNHKNYFDTQKPLCQVVSGGGGSDELQSRKFFGEPLGGYMKEYGFTLLSFDLQRPGLCNINLFSLDGTRLTFTSEDQNPVHKQEKDERVVKIRKLVLKKCEAYQFFLHKKQSEYNGNFFPSPYPFKLFGNNVTHKASDVELMHTIMNFINQPDAIDYKVLIQFLYQTMQKLSNKNSEHSLYLNINNKLKEEFDEKNIKKLHEELVNDLSMPLASC